MERPDWDAHWDRTTFETPILQHDEATSAHESGPSGTYTRSAKPLPALQCRAVSAILSSAQYEARHVKSSVRAGSGRVSAWGHAALRRPTCAFALEAAKTGAPRFLADNILALELEDPIRTTCDLGNPHAQVLPTKIMSCLVHACNLEQHVQAASLHTIAPWRLLGISRSPGYGGLLLGQT